MIITLLLLISQFPSASQTSWMEPAAFHLVLGDSRSNVEADFTKRGWSIDRADDGSFIHDYEDGKSVTMEFRDDRLTSIRFELVSFHPQLSADWDEVVAHLRERFGEPDVDRPSLKLIRTTALTIHAVLDDDRDSELGKQGAGRIIVRYFIPSDEITPAETRR